MHPEGLTRRQYRLSNKIRIWKPHKIMAPLKQYGCRNNSMTRTVYF